MKYSVNAVVLALCLCLVIPVNAAPQHWGFGFGYLTVLEEDASGNNVLSVYEPPLRVKDCPWLLRWRDSSGQYADVMRNGIAIGDFWPKPIGKEYLVAITGKTDHRLKGKVFVPPEVFSTRAWNTTGEVRLPQPGRAVSERFVAATAGKPLGGKRDLLLVLCQMGGGDFRYRLSAYEPPETPDEKNWKLVFSSRIDGKLRNAGSIRGIACADFTGSGEETVALLGKDIVFVKLLKGDSTDNQALMEVARDTLKDKERQAEFFVANDFLKDGFAYIAMGEDKGNKVAFRTGPKTDTLFKTIWIRENETFAGAKLYGQKMGEGMTIMTGERDNPAGKAVAAAAGRIFGYIIPGCEERKQKIWMPWKFQGFDDAEISFAQRTPVYRLGVPKKWQDGNWPWEPDDHYGWPFKDEKVTYEVHIKNNGKETIPAGKLKLRAWVDTPDRNADSLPDAGKTSNFTATIDKPIPPFNPEKPEYHVVNISFPWPYKLIQPEGWTWKKINVREIGERWLIMSLEYDGDENERNNRYEMALNAAMLRPVYKYDDEVNTLAFRAPTTTGDPESKEYITRKLADAVQCMWERSRTSKGEDVLQRVAFVGYRLGNGTTSRRDLDWSFYEGPRDLQKWIGLWGDYERSNPQDGGAELHETGHLFHRIGDLYHYFVMPTYTRDIKMADGTPVQMYTYAWGRDSYCDGQAIIGEGASDLHRYIEGVRYGLGFPWHRMLPDKVYVRVLDRDGEPVPGANLTWWYCSPGNAHEEGNSTTSRDGRWLTNMTKGRRYIFDPFNIPLYDSRAYDAIAHMFTVDINGYTDFGIIGAEDTDAHSRYTLMAKSITHRDGWTWDFHTLYKPGAPEPTFDVVCGVQGRRIVLNVESEKGRTYLLYRRWEPTYKYELIAEKEAQGDVVSFEDNMGEEDWFTGNRFRAVYYVTEIADGVESLPRRVFGIASENINGISDLGNGKLLVSLNCGKADPFGVIYEGTTPAEECIKHFRFGHTAVKIVPSKENPQRYYATLIGSDRGFDGGYPTKFDLIQFDKPDRFERRYPVVWRIAAPRVRSFSDSEPYTITLNEDPHASCAPNIGDVVLKDGRDDHAARILRIDGDAITVDKLIFDKEDRNSGLHVIQVAGEEGDGTSTRQLKNPRGLAVLQSDDKEYVAIADHGNGRVVVWDSTTKFIAEWKAPGFSPAAIATLPGREINTMLVLDRKKDGTSRLLTLKFDGTALSLVRKSGPIDVGDNEKGPEIGLALMPDPIDGSLVIAVTDASKGRVLEFKRNNKGRWEQIAEYTNAIGVYVGDAQLKNTTDCAYSYKATKGMPAIHLYAVDGRDRVIQLR